MNQNLIDHFMQSSFFEFFFSWMVSQQKIQSAKKQSPHHHHHHSAHSNHWHRHNQILQSFICFLFETLFRHRSPLGFRVPSFLILFFFWSDTSLDYNQLTLTKLSFTSTFSQSPPLAIFLANFF